MLSELFKITEMADAKLLALNIKLYRISSYQKSISEFLSKTNKEFILYIDKYRDFILYV